jgi:mannose-P-dolichol utilization defect protein 1
VTAELLQYLQMGAGAVAALSKLPQIIAIFREGGTGQLSAFTVSLPTTVEATGTNIQTQC